MKNTKKLIALALALVTLFAVGCDRNSTSENESENNTNTSTNKPGESIVNEENGGIVNEHIELADGEVVFRGVVTSLEYLNRIEMEIIDSQIAFGTYMVILGNETAYFGTDGNMIERTDIKVGDTIEVVFSGQVMNSYPPQIAAKRIYLV